MNERNELRPEILQDPRLRSVQWKDLTVLSPAEIVIELLLSFPWFLPARGCSEQWLQQVHFKWRHSAGTPKSSAISSYLKPRPGV